MLRYKIKSPPPKYPYDGWKPDEAFVILPTDDPDGDAQLEFEGHSHVIMLAREVLLSSSGINGHAIREWTTPLDLNVAMHGRRMKEFEPELIEGHEIVGASR